MSGLWCYTYQVTSMRTSNQESIRVVSESNNTSVHRLTSETMHSWICLSKKVMPRKTSVNLDENFYRKRSKMKMNGDKP